MVDLRAVLDSLALQGRAIPTWTSPRGQVIDRARITATETGTSAESSSDGSKRKILQALGLQNLPPGRPFRHLLGGRLRRFFLHISMTYIVAGAWPRWRRPGSCMELERPGLHIRCRVVDGRHGFRLAQSAAFRVCSSRVALPAKIGRVLRCVRASP